MGLNSYQMVLLRRSSWKHFLPKIVLSSASGQGHWRCSDCGSVTFYHRGGRGCQLLCAQERVGSRGEGTVINGGSCLNSEHALLTLLLKLGSDKALRRLLFLRVSLLAGASGDTSGKIRRWLRQTCGTFRFTQQTVRNVSQLSGCLSPFRPFEVSVWVSVCSECFSLSKCGESGFSRLQCAQGEWRTVFKDKQTAQLPALTGRTCLINPYS